MYSLEKIIDYVGYEVIVIMRKKTYIGFLESVSSTAIVLCMPEYIEETNVYEPRNLKFIRLVERFTKINGRVIVDMSAICKIYIPDE